MKSDIPAIIILLALAAFTYFLCGQRDMQIDAVNARLALLERQVGHGNIPQIIVMGKTTIYPVDGEITIAEVEK